MFEKFTYRGLSILSYIFLILAGLIIIGSLGFAIWGDFGDGTDQMSVAANRLGRTLIIFGGAIYTVIFMFLGLVSHALAILVKRSSNDRGAA